MYVADFGYYCLASDQEAMVVDDDGYSFMTLLSAFKEMESGADVAMLTNVEIPKTQTDRYSGASGTLDGRGNTLSFASGIESLGYLFEDPEDLTIRDLAITNSWPRTVALVDATNADAKVVFENVDQGNGNTTNGTYAMSSYVNRFQGSELIFRDCDASGSANLSGYTHGVFAGSISSVAEGEEQSHELTVVFENCTSSQEVNADTAGLYTCSAADLLAGDPSRVTLKISGCSVTGEIKGSAASVFGDLTGVPAEKQAALEELLKIACDGTTGEETKITTTG